MHTRVEIIHRLLVGLRVYKHRHIVLIHFSASHSNQGGCVSASFSPDTLEYCWTAHAQPTTSVANFQPLLLPIILLERHKLLLEDIQNERLAHM